jgi:hypothetical protein
MFEIVFSNGLVSRLQASLLYPDLINFTSFYGKDNTDTFHQNVGTRVTVHATLSNSQQSECQVSATSIRQNLLDEKRQSHNVKSEKEQD